MTIYKAIEEKLPEGSGGSEKSRWEESPQSASELLLRTADADLRMLLVEAFQASAQVEET